MTEMIGQNGWFDGMDEFTELMGLNRWLDIIDRT